MFSVGWIFRNRLGWMILLMMMPTLACIASVSVGPPPTSTPGPPTVTPVSVTARGAMPTRGEYVLLSYQEWENEVLVVPVNGGEAPFWLEGETEADLEDFFAQEPFFLNKRLLGTAEGQLYPMTMGLNHSAQLSVDMRSVVQQSFTTAGNRTTLEIGSLSEGVLTPIFTGPRARSYRFRPVLQTADGATVLFSNGPRLMRLDMATETAVELANFDDQPQPIFVVGWQSAAEMNAVVVHRNGVSLVDVETGKRQPLYEAQADDALHFVGFSAVYRELIVQDDRAVILFDLTQESQRVIHEAAAFDQVARHSVASWSPDGGRIAVDYSAGEIKQPGRTLNWLIIDRATGRSELVFPVQRVNSEPTSTFRLYHWSADSQSLIAFMEAPDPGRCDLYLSGCEVDLYRIDVATGTAQNLSKQSLEEVPDALVYLVDGELQPPRYSPWR